MSIDADSTLFWPVIKRQAKAQKDLIPFASVEDIGRHILRRVDPIPATSAVLGDAYDPSWACIGVIIAFNPMQELRLDPDLPAVEDEIGEDIAELYKRGIMDTWTVKYGDGSVENITTTPFIHGLQLHQKAVSSQEFRQNLKLKPEVLEMANSPPGFTKMSITEFKYRFCTHTKGKRRKGKEGKEEKEEEKGEDEVDAVSDTVCDICHSGMDEDKILLCDKCDKGFHTDCLNPPVTRIPKGSWFCAACVEIFTCEFCQKQFKTKPGYQYHRKNVCMTEEEEEARNKVLKEDEEGAEVYMEASVDPVTGRKIRQRKRVKRFAPTGFAEVVSDDEDADVVDGHPVAVRSVPGVSGKQRRRKRQEDDDDDDEDAEIDEDEEDESDDDDDDDEDEDDDDDIDDEVDNDNDDDVVIDKSASRSQKPRSRKPPTRRKRGRVMTDFSAYVDNGYQHLRQMFMELPMYEHAKALSGYAAAPNAAITTAGSSLSQLYESFRTNVVTTLRQNPPTPLTDWLHTHPTVHLPTIPVLVRESDDSILSLSTFQASVRPQASGVTNNASASASGSGTAKSFKGRSSAHSNDLHLDYFINAGGPIWDTSFAPLNTSIAHSPEVIYEKYLAVGLSQVGWPEEDSLADGLFTCTGQFGFAQDIAHVIGKPILYPNLLQIWKVSKTRVPASSVATESESAAASNAAPLLVRNMLSATVAADGQSVRSSASVLANGPRVQTEVTLQFCVGLEQRGAVWKTAWSPHTYPASSTSTSSGSEMTDSLVGLLAVVCGDGSCLVLALPKSPVAAAPAAAGAADSRSAMSTAGKGNRAGNSKASTTATSSSTMSTITDILVSESSDVGQTAVIPEDSVCQWEISVPGVAIVSVTWNPHQPLELCCGMTDGTITLWDLTKAKPPSATSNSSNSNPTKTILQQPSRMLMDVLVDQRSPVVAAVNSLQFCPYNPALLSSGGLDGALKIWNIIHSPNKPMFVRKLPHLGYIQDLRWDPYGNGVFCAGPDSTTVYWEPIWTSPAELERHSVLTHNTQFAGVWKLLAIPYDGHTALVSASSDGSVRTAFLFHSVFLRGSASDLYAQELLRIQEVSEEIRHLNDQQSSSGGAVGGSGSGNGDDYGGSKCGMVSLVLDQSNTRNRRLKQVQKSHIPTASMGIHSVDCCLLDSSSTSASSSSGNNKLDCLFAYGGASGIIRIHTNNLKTEAILN